MISEPIILTSFIIVGLTIFIYQFRIIIKAKKSENWEIAKGEILLSELVSHNFSGETNKTFRAEISYKYIVNKREYVSNRIYYGDKLESNFSKRAIGLLNKYPTGKKVEVYYNPLNEKEALLEKGVKVDVMVLLVIGLLFILAGIFFFLI